MIETVGQLVDELLKYDRDLPTQAIIMEGGFAIDKITSKPGFKVETNEPIDIICLHILCDLPVYIP